VEMSVEGVICRDVPPMIRVNQQVVRVLSH
jgi:hypothetical protein